MQKSKLKDRLSGWNGFLQTTENYTFLEFNEVTFWLNDCKTKDCIMEQSTIAPCKLTHKSSVRAPLWRGLVHHDSKPQMVEVNQSQWRPYMPMFSQKYFKTIYIKTSKLNRHLQSTNFVFKLCVSTMECYQSIILLSIFAAAFRKRLVLIYIC